MTRWPWSWTRWRLLRRLDIRLIEEAIERAEARTSGEIRVSVVGFFRGDLWALAERAFKRLGMTATRHRNAVLILVAPARHKFVVLGDEGIHARLGDSFWSTVKEALESRFREEEFTAGLVEAIDRIATGLAVHFPPAPSGGDVNELSNSVDVARNP